MKTKKELGFRRLAENSPAQRDSKFSKWGNCPLSPLCLFCPLARNNRPAQRHSKFSKMGICCSTRPSRTVDFGISPRRARGTTPKAIFENSPAQLDSRISKLRLGMLGIMGILRSLEQQPVRQNHLVQQHSK